MNAATRLDRHSPHWRAMLTGVRVDLSAGRRPSRALVRALARTAGWLAFWLLVAERAAARGWCG